MRVAVQTTYNFSKLGKQPTELEKCPEQRARHIISLLSFNPTPNIHSNKITESLGQHGRAFQIYDEVHDHKIDAPKPMTQVIATLAKPQDEKMAREAISASIDGLQRNLNSLQSQPLIMLL